jgi:hypothetical protein
MPNFALRLSVPASLTVGEAKRTFYWTPEGRDSFVTACGPSLGVLGPVPKPNIELVRLAAGVIAADRTTPRRAQGSNWSRREIQLAVPVFRPERWEPVSERLAQLLAFLSGDNWSLQFVRSRSARERVATVPTGASRVVLLSGGADSAVGALLSRHKLGEASQVLVSHVGATSLAPIQRTIAESIEKLLTGPAQDHHQIRFSRHATQPNGVRFPNEFSTRARSLLFIALGLAVASIEKLPLWVPENGFASLNPPLAPDQRGSLSTRTTHPAFLVQLQALPALALRAPAFRYVGRRTCTSRSCSIGLI